MRRRGNRQKRGKWVLGNRIMGVGRGGGRRSNGGQSNFAVTNQPVTRGVSRTTVSGPLVHRERGTEEMFRVTADGSGTGYYCNAYQVNPCNPEMFTRLSKIAENYQRFTCSAISVMYLPSRGTGQTGQVIISFAADPKAAIPTSTEEQLAIQGTLSFASNLPSIFRFDPSKLNGSVKNYLTKAPESPGEGGEIYNEIGRFFVGVTDVSDSVSVNLGRLQISYTFTFSEPKVETTPGTGAQADGSCVSGVVVPEFVNAGRTVAVYQTQQDQNSDIFTVTGIAPLQVFVETTHATTAATVVVEYSTDNGLTWLDPPMEHTCETATKMLNIYGVPPGRRKMRFSTADTLDYQIRIFTSGQVFHA